MATSTFYSDDRRSQSLSAILAGLALALVRFFQRSKDARPYWALILHICMRAINIEVLIEAVVQFLGIAAAVTEEEPGFGSGRRRRIGGRVGVHLCSQVSRQSARDLRKWIRASHSADT